MVAFLPFQDPTDDEIEKAARMLLDRQDDEALGQFSTRNAVSTIAWVSRPAVLEDEHRTVYSAWQQADTGTGPRQADMHPETFVSQLGKVMLLDVLDNGFDARYRIYGGKIAASAGRDWTGYRVSEMNRMVRTDLALFYRACYRAVFLANKLLLTVHKSPPFLPAQAWSRLILPLYDPAGAMARFIVSNLPKSPKNLSPREMRELHERVVTGTEPAMSAL